MANCLFKACSAGLIVLAGASAQLASAQQSRSNRGVAKSIYERLASVPPDEQTLDQAEALVAKGDLKGAANLAIKNPNFINVTIKQWAKPMTSVSRSAAGVSLNDYVATVMGMVRDNVPFDQVLYGDILYTSDLAQVPGTTTNIPPYAMNNNRHYDTLEGNNIDLSVPANLTRHTQSGVYATAPIDDQGTVASDDKPGVDIAGVLTTRAAGEAFFSNGTNRRMFRFTMMNFLCRDLDKMHDISRPDFRVRKDVSRAPGGNSKEYLTFCVGCHAIQDPFAGAFAFFDFDRNRVRYTQGAVQGKYHINEDAFPTGFNTVDDSWINNALEGVNQGLGWRQPAGMSIKEGKGIHSFGMIIAKTQAFSQCMAKRAFKQVCLRDPASSEIDAVNDIATQFEQNNYNLKTVFASVATVCTGR